MAASSSSVFWLVLPIVSVFDRALDRVKMNTRVTESVSHYEGMVTEDGR